MIRSSMKRLLRRLGYVASRYDRRRDPIAVRQAMLLENGIDIVLDVGANAGQFGTELRRGGFGGTIVSFEPLAEAYGRLVEAARQDPSWHVRHCALGAANGSAKIHIASNSWSSSLLPMHSSHLESAPDSAYVGEEDVDVRTVDSLFHEHCCADSRVFMKIDTQGFTMEVLMGAQQVLPRVRGLQVELSLIPLYVNEPLIGEVVSYLYGEGFSLVYIEPEFMNAAGHQLQVNGLFLRGSEAISPVAPY
jgi:FkbM family methyltransferase